MMRQPDDPGPGRYVPYEHLDDDGAFILAGVIIVGALAFFAGMGLGVVLTLWLT